MLNHNQNTLTNVTWTNGNISLTSDLIFGVSVLGEDGWCPLSSLSEEDLEMVRRMVDHNPGCPFKDQLYTANKVN